MRIGFRAPIIEKSGDVTRLIRPKQIDLSRNLKGALRSHIKESAAVGLVQFFQKQNIWTSFTAQDLDEFFRGRELTTKTVLSALGDDPSDPGKHTYVVAVSEKDFAITKFFVSRVAEHAVT
jgi:hypothetical protein